MLPGPLPNASQPSRRPSSNPFPPHNETRWWMDPVRRQARASLFIFLFNVLNTFVTDVSFMDGGGHLFTGRLDYFFGLLGGVGRNEELHGNPKALVHNHTPSYGMVGKSLSPAVAQIP
jgi:hypothetical protein